MWYDYPCASGLLHWHWSNPDAYGWNRLMLNLLTTLKHDIGRTMRIFPGMYCIPVKCPGYFREQNIQGNLTGMVLYFSLSTWTCWFSRGNLQQLRSWLTAKQLFVPLQWCWNGFVYVLDVLNLGTNRDRSARVTVAVCSIYAKMVDCHPTR